MIASCSDQLFRCQIFSCAHQLWLSPLSQQTRDEQSLDLAAVPLCILDASTVLNIAWQLQTKASVDAHTVSKWETHTEHLWQQGTQCPFQNNIHQGAGSQSSFEREHQTVIGPANAVIIHWLWRHNMASVLCVQPRSSQRSDQVALIADNPCPHSPSVRACHCFSALSWVVPKIVNGTFKSIFQVQNLAPNQPRCRLFIFSSSIFSTF